MRGSQIRVIFSGAGRVVRDVTQLLRVRSSVRIVAAYSRDPALVGKDLGVLAGGAPLSVVITDDRSTALTVPADILVIATTSFLRDVAIDIKGGIENGLNVLCTAEEMAFPWLSDEGLAEEIDVLAKKKGVTVLGGGVNPGFLSDALVLTAASAAWNVDHISVRRAVNLRHFSATILRRLGVGFSVDDFETGTQAGEIFGHIGYPESMHLVARALGLQVEKVTQSFTPLLAEVDIALDHFGVQKGLTAGFRQHATAYVEGKPWFEAEFLGHVDPDSIGARLQDEIHVEGYSPVHLVITPGLQAQAGVAALIANSLRRVVAAPPGLVTVADLPPARPSPTMISTRALGGMVRWNA